jgi:hypothetical protein
MSDQPKPPDVEATEEHQAEEQARMLEEQRRALREEMRKAVAIFRSIVKGEPAPPKPR